MQPRNNNNRGRALVQLAGQLKAAMCFAPAALQRLASSVILATNWAGVFNAALWKTRSLRCFHILQDTSMKMESIPLRLWALIPPLFSSHQSDREWLGNGGAFWMFRDRLMMCQTCCVKEHLAKRCCLLAAVHSLSLRANHMKNFTFNGAHARQTVFWPPEVLAIHWFPSSHFVSV